MAVVLLALACAPGDQVVPEADPGVEVLTIAARSIEARQYAGTLAVHPRFIRVVDGQPAPNTAAEYFEAAASTELEAAVDAASLALCELTEEGVCRTRAGEIQVALSAPRVGEGEATVWATVYSPPYAAHGWRYEYLRIDLAQEAGGWATAAVTLVNEEHQEI